MEITTIQMPPMSIRFDPHLLSIPIWIHDAERLRQIGDWILERINRGEFGRHPNTVKLLVLKYQQFMELYERAKIKERETKEEKGLKTHAPFYRPRHVNRNDQRLFERLELKVQQSWFDWKNNKISKIR